FTGPAASHLDTLSLHDALPILVSQRLLAPVTTARRSGGTYIAKLTLAIGTCLTISIFTIHALGALGMAWRIPMEIPQAIIADAIDRKSTRLNSSHVKISYAVFC